MQERIMKFVGGFLLLLAVIGISFRGGLPGEVAANAQYRPPMSSGRETVPEVERNAWLVAS